MPRASSCIRAPSGSSDPAVREIAAFADEQRLPIIVHAGRGVPSLGRDALELACAFPHAPIILAHLAISDLAWIWHEAAGQHNLFFDTAWWNTADQLALFTLIPPGQILFASDTPYGRTVAAASLVLRVALAAGLSAEQISAVAGGQLERLLAGAQPHDLGPAPMTPAPSPGPLLERVHALLIAAAARLTAGYPADEYLELARLACELPADHPDAAAAAVSPRAARPPRRPPRDRPAPPRTACPRHPPDLRCRRRRPHPQPAAPRPRDAHSRAARNNRTSGAMSTARAKPQRPEGAEAAFRRRHPAYAETAVLDELRRTEFARLDRGHVYLDYTGGGLCADSQLREHVQLLEHGVFGNPHSVNSTSAASTKLVERARAAVLAFFRASPEEYVAIFTPNATGALRLVGEAYPFPPGTASCSPSTTTTRSTESASSPAPAAPKRPTCQASRPTCASTKRCCRAT